MKGDTKPNVIFVIVDALRAGNLGCYGYNRETSPNIDKLAKNGVLFENAFSSNNVTDRSFVSILGGKHILSSGELDFLLKKEEIEFFFSSGGVFLQEILKKNGYKTYCLKNLTNWRKKGFDYYFEDKGLKKFSVKEAIQLIKRIPLISQLSKFLFYYILPKKVAYKIRTAHRRPTRSTDEALRIIREKKEEDRFFMWIDYNDTHIPYSTPSKFANKFKAEKKTEKFFEEISKKNYKKELIDFYKTIVDRRDSLADLASRYDCAIAYDDYLMSTIIKALEEKGILNNTIILFISDHGESLGEHDIYFDHNGLYDVTTHVPFIIIGKTLPKNKRIKAFVQLEDIAPTILDLAGIEYDPFVFDGKSLLPLINGKEDKLRDCVFMEETYRSRKAAIRNHNYKYVESPSKEEAVCTRCRAVHGGVVELYDLKKDPGETKNIARENRDIVIKMSLKLNKIIRDIKSTNEKRRINKAIAKL